MSLQMDLLDAEVKIENPDDPEDGESSLQAGKKPRFTLDEDAAMWKFVGENLHLGPMKMWEEFKKCEGSDRASHGLYRRFKRSLAPNLHLTNLDIPTKLEIYKKYQIPVDLTYIETLKMHANLEIDYSGCIRNYSFTESSRSRKPKRPEKQAVFVFPNSDDEDDDEAASGDVPDENGAENVNPELAKLVLETYQQQQQEQMHQNPTNPTNPPNPEEILEDQNPESDSSHQSNSNYQRFTPEEDASLWKFVIENPECRGSLKMWDGYRKKYQTKRSLSSLYFRFKKVLSPNLHRCDFDVETKLKLYKNYQIPVDQEYLTVLKNQAKLEIDENWCIVSYRLDHHHHHQQKVPEKRRTSSERLPEENSKPKRQKTVGKDSEARGDQKEGSVGAENTSTSSSNISEFIEGVLEQFQQEFDETMAQETQEQQKEDLKDQKEQKDQKDQNQPEIPGLQSSEFEARIISEVTRNVETMISEMARNMEGKMAKIAETVGELKDTVQVVRESQIDKDSVVIKKSDLEKLQNMLQTMKSAEMDEIQKRISTAMEK